MPEADVTRKRSRSPSESENKQHKRPNTGAADNSESLARARDDASVKREDDGTTGASTTSSPSHAATGGEGGDGSVSVGAEATISGSASGTPMANIHMRCLIVTQDASIIIGKGGAHVNEIREKSGAKVMVTESIPGNPERILNVHGPLDAVSKAFGLIVRRINDEPFDKPSVPGSRAVTIKFMIPNSRMGSVIGKAGTKIKEIQEASGARLNASEGMLPGSTDRVLSVSGVADAIHIATYYIGNILIEANERQPATRDSSYRPTAYSRRPGVYSGGPGGAPPAGGSSYVPGGYSAPPPPPHHAPNPYGAHPTPHPPPGVPLQTQQIFIPNDLVGCIIGKGGSKINEIRQMSASTIKIMEPGAQNSMIPGAPAGGADERLVVITGAPQNIQLAVQMLYTRLEQEKQKQLRQQM